MAGPNDGPENGLGTHPGSNSTLLNGFDRLISFPDMIIGITLSTDVSSLFFTPTNFPTLRTIYLSAILNTSFILCEIIIMLMPLLFSILIKSYTFCVSATPRAAVGSSIIITSALKYTALLIATICLCPPDRLLTFTLRLGILIPKLLINLKLFCRHSSYIYKTKFTEKSFIYNFSSKKYIFIKIISVYQAQVLIYWFYPKFSPASTVFEMFQFLTSLTYISPPSAEEPRINI